jgi:pimeloyl-ACP methyl ester carboxylesterase
VREEPFEVPVEGGALRGHRALADAAPALLLHGGAAVTDYTEGLAKELDGRFATIRYTQRGTPPSFGPPPYSIETNASLSDHLARGTLARTLPAARVPALLVHGELDPLPLRSATETAALIPGAEVAVIEGCGHFPWIECPGEVRSAVERWLV